MNACGKFGRGLIGVAAIQAYRFADAAGYAHLPVRIRENCDLSRRPGPAWAGHDVLVLEPGKKRGTLIGTTWCCDADGHVFQDILDEQAKLIRARDMAWHTHRNSDQSATSDSVGVTK